MVAVPASTSFADELELLRQTVRQLVQSRVEPQAMAHDQSGTFNTALLRELGELGLLGITIPEADGGAGMTATASVIVHDELAYSDPGFALGYLAHALLFVNNFYWAASAEQRARYLPRVLAGTTVGAMGMTEPAVGTDVLGMQTTARKVGDGYVLNGRKTFITNGPEAGVALVYAKLADRITTFVVERGTPGFSAGPKIDKLGMRASDTCPVYFEDVRVPQRHRIGQEGMGFMMQMLQFQEERLCGAIGSVRGMERVIAATIAYCKERQTFGRPLIANQVVHFRFAELQTEVEALRSLCYRAVEDYVGGADVTLFASMAKLKAGRLSREVADACVQYWGGMGFTWDNPAARSYRDSRLLSIGGGADEIMLGIICKLMGILPGKERK